jgi:hypothetical protein
MGVDIFTPDYPWSNMDVVENKKYVLHLQSNGLVSSTVPAKMMQKTRFNALRHSSLLTSLKDCEIIKQNTFKIKLKLWDVQYNSTSCGRDQKQTYDQWIQGTPAINIYMSLDMRIIKHPQSH